ncbi:MAG: hypothetical protein AAGJ35_04820, partial [Myxococcota bacterium]
MSRLLSKSMRPSSGVIYICTLFTLAFFLSINYALTRPPIESLFLKEFGSQAMPTAWIVTTIAVFVVASVYNRFGAHVPLLHLMGYFSLFNALFISTLFWLQRQGVPHLTFAMYIWKDVYIVAIIEIFWAFANHVFTQRKAKWLYGLFCAIGSAGSIVGSLKVKNLAVHWGTTQMIWLIPISFLLLTFLSWSFARILSLSPPQQESPT